MERPIKIRNTRNPLPEKLKDHGTSTFDGIEVKVYQTVTMIWKSSKYKNAKGKKREKK